jgi:hypothetical protein
MKTILAIAAAITLSGCATSEKFVAKMDSFIGQPEKVVISSYGVPQGSTELKDGSKVLRYTRGSKIVVPQVTTMQPAATASSGSLMMDQGMRQTTANYTQQSPSNIRGQGTGTRIALTCTITFTVGSDGIVRRWNASGDQCES